MYERKGILMITHNDLKFKFGLEDFDIQWVNPRKDIDAIEIFIKGDKFPYEHLSGGPYCRIDLIGLREILGRKA